MATINERNPTPLSREVLQGLKQQVDEEKRQRQISDVVNMIYGAAYHTAKNSTDRFFSYVLPTYAESPYKLYREETLTKLQSLFPDSAVYYGLVVMDKWGKRHILNKLDPAIHHIIHVNEKKEFVTQEAIIIDWS